MFTVHQFLRKQLLPVLIGNDLFTMFIMRSRGPINLFLRQNIIVEISVRSLVKKVVNKQSFIRYLEFLGHFSVESYWRDWYLKLSTRSRVKSPLNYKFKGYSLDRGVYVVVESFTGIDTNSLMRWLSIGEGGGRGVVM